MDRLNAKTLASLVILLLAMGAVIFGVAGSLAYWQAWLFLLIYFFLSLCVSIDLMRRDRALLERRMRGGPFAEKEPVQRLIMTIISLWFIGLLSVPALDHRFDWSHMSVPAVLGGDVLVVAGFVGIWRVFRENTFSAATVDVVHDQIVISTGPYAIVRHPMYAAALVLLTGVPIALGSWWGLAMTIVILPILMWRLLHEEAVLAERLSGYAAYQGSVRWRLVPLVW
ncbi:isoprenylcysteine carboxylmethyltransferase family protein [Bradyrhizobium sp. STM 3809]|uniref:methyltransferase family protein n=1 Tax=Bradyrhizobium sp. STM 3809 TaxID=551936 RepID=UPI0002407CA0|nr:isoprenylcysteine carboxylmethyltransferase family protein [Bradyrhizobium sp. STM 3809]CCE02584.1 conserved membrane hypothetical protein [Bradyrhizobium sp. STM 3809]